MNFSSLLLANYPAEHQHVTEDDDEKYKSEHQTRLTQLCFEDPVHTVCLRDFLQNQVNIYFPLMLSQFTYKISYHNFFNNE